jgi:hypothetical protein
MPNVDTMAAINAPTGGLKNVAITSPVDLFLNSFGIFCIEGINVHSTWGISWIYKLTANALTVSAREHTRRYTASIAYTLIHLPSVETQQEMGV